MSSTSPAELVGEATRLFADFLDQGMRLAARMLEIQVPSTGALVEVAQRAIRSAGPCDIPTPCWMPESLGEVRSRVCPGATAIVRLTITNCGATARIVEVQAAGATSGVEIKPEKLQLPPMERATVTASVAVPASASAGESREILLWVRGCRDHVLRWTVDVATRGDSCKVDEVKVEDCPDLIHHWYDHFYCEHPCSHRSGRLPGGS